MYVFHRIDGLWPPVKIYGFNKTDEDAKITRRLGGERTGASIEKQTETVILFFSMRMEMLQQIRQRLENLMTIQAQRLAKNKASNEFIVSRSGQ